MFEQILRYLPFLLCPLMMLFCMRGMFSKDKNCHNKTQGNNNLEKQIGILEGQNRILLREIEELKKGININK